MSFESKKIREERGELASKANAILVKAADEKRDMTAEETAEFDKIHADIDAKRLLAERMERQEALNAELADSRPIEKRVGRDDTKPGRPGSQEVTIEDRQRAIRTWMLAGSMDAPISDDDLDNARRCGVNPMAKNWRIPLLRGNAPKSIKELEKRAQSVGTTTAGGHTVPQGAMQAIETALLHFGSVRNEATVLRTGDGRQLPFPTANDTGNVGRLLSENSQVTATDVTFGQITLSAYLFDSDVVQVSEQLMTDSSINLEEYLGQILGERIARIQNQYFSYGTGSSQPKGVAVAAVVGQNRAVPQTVTYSELISLIHSVDVGYRTKAKFMMDDSWVAEIKKLVDSQNRPLWTAGMSEGAPDKLLGYPWVVNNDLEAKGETGSDNDDILFGDFTKYTIREVGEVVVRRLEERYADYHQIGFLASIRSDGNLIDAGTRPLKRYSL